MCCILADMIWSRLAALRTAVLVLCGFGALCTAAFIAHPIIGWSAIGVSLLLIEALTNPDFSLPAAARGRA